MISPHARVLRPQKKCYMTLVIFLPLLKHQLIHCKSGADRAGLMSALYLIIAKEQSAREAMGQLNWKYGHVKAAKTGVIDAFFRPTCLTKNKHGILTG